MNRKYSTQQALVQAISFSVNDLPRLELLAASADRQAQISRGDFIELGVFRGGSAILLASAIKNYPSPLKLHLLDSWEGLPSPTAEDNGTPVYRGLFAESSEDAVRARLDKLDLLNVCKTYRGLVEQSLPEINTAFSLAHIDLDLYRPVRYALSWLMPRMTIDGEIIIDDYGNESIRRFPGVEKAVSELLIDSDWKIVETAGKRDHSVRLVRK